MTMPSLEKFFAPQSVAIVGASDTPGRVGYAVIRNLISSGFMGPIYPVNAGRKKINGIPAFPKLAAIDKAIDLAVVATPIDAVPSVIEDCARSGIGSAAL